MTTSSRVRSDLNEYPLNERALMDVLAELDDSDLEELEDDLNFYHFSGVASERLQAIFDRAQAIAQAA